MSEQQKRPFGLGDEAFFDPSEGQSPEPVSPPPPLPTHAEDAATAARRVALEAVEEWRRIERGERLPAPVGPPPSPPGHAELPSAAAVATATGGQVLAPTNRDLGSDLDPRSIYVRDAIDAERGSGVAEPAQIQARLSGSATSTVDDPNAPTTERAEPRQEAPDGIEIVLPLDSVLCDSKKNRSRRGVAWLPDDHEVVEMADSIVFAGLINPMEVRELEEPIAREVPSTVVYKHAETGEDGERKIVEKPMLVTHYTHELVNGFKRFAALRLLGRSFARFTDAPIDQATAVLHNGIENIVRTEQTDYDLAIYFAELAHARNWSADQVARALGASPARVSALLVIVERLPSELLERFRVSPTSEVRRDLAKIAKIERETREETHQAMIDAWVQLQEQRRVEKLEKEEKKKEDRSLGRSSRTMNRLEMDRFRVSVRQATEYYEPLTGTWIAITEEARAFGDVLLRRVSDPKSRSPLR